MTSGSPDPTGGPARRGAARRGAARGRREIGDPAVVVGWPAAAAATVHALSPHWTLEGLALINRLLPTPTGSGGPLRGKDVQGRLPELLSQRIPAGAGPSVNPSG